MSFLFFISIFDFSFFFFFFQAEDGIRDVAVTGVQTCALPISAAEPGLGVEAGQLGVADGAQEGEEEREADAGPDVAPHRRAARRRRCRLQLKRDPEKRSRRDQRHGVHRRARKTERRFHTAYFCSWCCGHEPASFPSPSLMVSVISCRICTKLRTVRYHPIGWSGQGACAPCRSRSEER